MKRFGVTIALVSLIFAGSSMAMDKMQHGSDMSGDTKAMEGMQHGSDMAGDTKTMEGMQNGGDMKSDTFMHKAMVDDVNTEFQVMDLASMKMTDPDGKTHHVMATFMRGDEKITKMAGKMKLIAPSGKEQVVDMKDFGGGNFAANVMIDEPGKWGVICLFKDEMGQHTVKFWYEHKGM